MYGAEPNPTAIWLAQTPTHEAIKQKVQAIHNVATNNCLVMDKFFTKTTKDLVDRVDGKLATLANNINMNTDK